MTSPIPLTSPSGIVFAYACGECRRIGTLGAYLTARYDDEDVRRLCDDSLKQADRCCRCDRCKAPYVRDGWLGSRVCDACRPVQDAEDVANRARWQAEAATNADARARSLLAAKDQDAAVNLEREMSDISEAYYCAGWLLGLEFSLWAMIQGGSRSFGLSEVHESEVSNLRRLSEKAGGWWRYERFVPIEEWLKVYEAGPEMEE